MTTKVHGKEVLALDSGTSLALVAQVAGGNAIGDELTTVCRSK